jgi:hypothetical protein
VKNLIGKTVETAAGRRVLVLDVWDGIALTDRGYVHMSKLKPSTAR